MIIEKSERAAHDRFAVAENIQRKAEARRKIVFVAWKSLLNAERILRGENIACRQIDARKRVVETDGRNRLRQLDIVANAVIESQSARRFPSVLREKGNRRVFDCADRVAETLNIS